MHGKLEALKDLLAGYRRVAVAFSGGVDSTLLLAVAHDVLADGAVAFTATSAVYPARELDEAREFCEKRGIRQVVFESVEMSLEGFAHNPENRCYLCKTSLFGQIVELARAEGIDVVVEGSNADDASDYRPGRKAVEEMGIRSPLSQVGLLKDEIRALSREMGLPTWDKQSFACLASRFQYGDLITNEKLAMVDAAEQLLLDEGFTQVRVRLHGDVARIELKPREFERIMDEQTRMRVVDGVKRAGFAYVALDLQGYRTGAMNETL